MIEDKIRECISRIIVGELFRTLVNEEDIIKELTQLFEDEKHELASELAKCLLKSKDRQIEITELKAEIERLGIERDNLRAHKRRLRRR